MRLIRKGTPKSEQIWAGTCRNCRSEFEAKRGELVVTDDQRDGPFAWHQCSVCDAGSGPTAYGGICFYPKRGSQ